MVGSAGMPAKTVLGSIVAALRSDAIVLAAAGTYVALSLAYLQWHGLVHLWRVGADWTYPESVQVGTALVLCAFACATGRLRAWASTERIVGGLLVLVLHHLLNANFFAVKQALWVTVPYSWDATFHALDGWVHAGYQPAAWAAAHLSNAAIVAIDRYYFVGWGHALLITLAVAAWSERRELRHQILLAYIGVWAIAGNALAGLFASAGPCYVEALTGATWYRPLTDRLAAVDSHTPLIASLLQRLLWRSAAAGQWSAIGGISAMPSVHLALATVTVLYWSRRGRRWRVAGVLFVGAVQVGSVALGWHYAVDGYAGIAIGVGLWWGAGRLVASKRQPRTISAESAAA